MIEVVAIQIANFLFDQKVLFNWLFNFKHFGLNKRAVVVLFYIYSTPVAYG